MCARAFSFPLSVKEKSAQGQFSLPEDQIRAGNLAKANNRFLIGALIAPKMHSFTVHLPFGSFAQKTNQGHWTPSLDLQSYISIIGSGCRHQCVATQWTSQAQGARGAKESINHWAAELTRHLTISGADFSGQSRNALRRQPEHELCVLPK